MLQELMPGAHPEKRYSIRVATKHLLRLDVLLLPGRVGGEQPAGDADGRSTHVMCDFMLSSDSKKTPRSRTTADGGISFLRLTLSYYLPTQYWLKSRGVMTPWTPKDLYL